MNDISTKMQRGMLLPKGSPPEAVQALRDAFQALGKDAAFARDFKAITGEEPDVVEPAEIEAIFDRIRKVDPGGEAGAARVGRPGRVVARGRSATW